MRGTIAVTDFGWHEFLAGRAAIALLHRRGVRVSMPDHEQPASEYLRWHNDHVYRG